MPYKTDFATARKELRGNAEDALIADALDPAVKLYIAFDKNSPAALRQIMAIMVPMSVISALVNVGLLSSWLALQTAKDGVLIGYEVVQAKAASALKSVERVTVDALVDTVNATNRAYHSVEAVYQEGKQFAEKTFNAAKQTAESVLEALVRAMTTAYKAAKETVFGKPEATLETTTLSSSASAPNLGTSSTAKIGSFVGLHSASAPNLTTKGTPTQSPAKKEVEQRPETTLENDAAVTYSPSFRS